MCSYSSEQVNQKKCYSRRYVHIAVNRIIKRNAIQEDLKSPDYKIRTFFIIGGFNVKFCFLTDKFFDLYKECEEIEKKNNRPYATICLLKYNNLYFAIPIRHNIKH